MPKITIDLNVNTHRILKELAKKDRRSLTNYINITLEDYALNNEKNLSSLETSEEKTVNTTKPVKKSIIGDEEEYYREYGNKGEEILGWQ